MRAVIMALVENEVRISLASPAFRRLVYLLAEGADAGWQRHAFGREEGKFAFSIQARRGDCRVGQPVERDVVQDIVAREAFARAIEHPRNEVIALDIMVDD